MDNRMKIRDIQPRLVLWISLGVLSVLLSACMPSTSVINIGAVGQNRPAVVNVSVSGKANTASPTGTMTITVNNGVTGCTVPLDAGGNASCTITFPQAIQYTVKAAYGGDNRYKASQVSQTVNVQADRPTSISFINMPTLNGVPQVNPGGELDFQVKMTGPEAQPAIDPTVPVKVDIGGLGLCMLNMTSTNNQQDCKITLPKSVGTYIVIANFPGDNIYGPSNASASFDITPFVTSLSVVYGGGSYKDGTVPGDFNLNTPYPLGIKIDNGPDPLVGTVSFIVGGGTGCTLSSLTSTCDVTFTSGGAQKVIASYSSGTPLYNSSLSTVTFGVGFTATVTTITTSPATVEPGQPTFVTVTVVNSGSGNPPTGNVNVAGPSGCTITLVNGTGTCTLSFKSVGNPTIKADYPGDSTHSPSSGTTVQHINLPEPTAAPEPTGTVAP